MSRLPPESGRLVTLAGLPGVGKTTIAKAFCLREFAIYLRIDTIEASLRRAAPGFEIGPAGYEVAQAVAEENLRHGRLVVADCVNPLEVSRDGWRAVAAGVEAGLLEVEVVCSDPHVHRRRVEGRPDDLVGLRRPSWDEVQARVYEPWTRDRLSIDTATRSIEEAVEDILCALRRI